MEYNEKIIHRESEEYIIIREFDNGDINVIITPDSSRAIELYRYQWEQEKAYSPQIKNSTMMTASAFLKLLR